MKSTIKKLLPSSLRAPLLKIYHYLQGLAAVIRYSYPARGMKFVMITGTNGKTTTTGYLTEVFQAAGLKVGVSSTAFYLIGDDYQLNTKNMTVVNPFAVQKMLKAMRQAEVDVVIMETTSHALDQHRLLSIKPFIAAMTNLTQDHLDYHKTMANYAAAKAKLFKKNPAHVVLNADDEWFDFYNVYSGTRSTSYFGEGKQATARFSDASFSANGSSATISSKNGSYTLKTSLLGKFNLYNALCAATIAESYGLDQQTIAAGIENLTAVPGRMEPVPNKRGVTILVDYAHTADALHEALTTLREVTSHRLFCVFGATGDRDKSKRPEMGRVVAELADVAVVTDDEPYSEDPATIRAEVLAGANAVKNGGEVVEFADRREAIHETIRRAKPGDTVVLTGIGHQQFRVIGPNKQKIAWSDADVAKEIL